MGEILLDESQKVSAKNNKAPELMDSEYNADNLYKVDKMSLEETKEKLDWRKSAFEQEKKNPYEIENWNDMTRMHNNEVNNIADELYHMTWSIPPTSPKI